MPANQQYDAYRNERDQIKKKLEAAKKALSEFFSEIHYEDLGDMGLSVFEDDWRMEVPLGTLKGLKRVEELLK